MSRTGHGPTDRHDLHVYLRFSVLLGLFSVFSCFFVRQQTANGQMEAEDKY